MTFMEESTPKTTPRRGLKKKLILSMLLVGVLPLLIGLLMATFQGVKEIREANGASFQALAVETARKVDLVLSEEDAKNRLIATDPGIIQALEERRDRILDTDDAALAVLLAEEAKAWTQEDPELVSTVTDGPMAKILRRYFQGMFGASGRTAPPVNRSATRALFITDIRGRLVASINTDVPYLHEKEPWWQGTYNDGVGHPYFGNVSFNTRLNTYTFTLSLPIMDSIRYQAVGVLHRIYDSKEFFDSSIDIIRFGKTGHVMLIDSDGIVMSCPILPTGTRLADPDLIPLVTPRHPGYVQAPSDGHGGQSTSIIGFAPLPGATRITDASTGKAWHLFVWQSSQELFSPIQHLLTWIGAFGLIAIGLLVALGSIAAGRILTPISRLQEAARLIGKGELHNPITIKTGDEIEELAEEVNRMNARLQEAFGGLRSEVASKTEEVQYLQESTDQILNGVPNPVLMLDSQERIQYMNEASKTAFGLDGINGQGTSFFEVLTIDQKDQQKIRQEIQNLARGADPDASQVSPVGVSAATQLQDPLAPKSSPHDDQGKPFLEINQRVYRYDWFSVKGRGGEEQQFGLVLRDTTDESQLQDQLAQNEKWASLGVLSSGIGHELNNPLVGVIGLGEAIQDEQDLTQIRDYAKNIVRHGRRMASVVQDFTGEIRRQTQGRPSPVDLNDQLTQSLKYVQLTYDSMPQDVQTNFQPLPTITAQPEEIRQAFINILSNSVQAMQGKGSLDLETQCSDGVISISIRDSGPGIPKAYISKVFDPFFTTKRQGEGSGLGLTIVRRIINRHGGQIKIDSAEGRGTSCLITFPVGQSHAKER